MRIRLSFTLNKSYYIEALTYWAYCNQPNNKVLNLTKNKADKIVRDRVYWSGKSNWVGDGGQVHEMLGDATDEYNKLQVAVTEWVNTKYRTL